MLTFADILVPICLFTSGFFFGYYFKFAYIYDNLWNHWYAWTGIIAALALAGIWTLYKYKQRQYRFCHFYVIFYGLTCYVISCCFMLTDNLDIAFYFGFIGLGTTLIPCYSLISLRSDAEGTRPARVALGNCFYYGGFTTGFAIFNEFEAKQSGWIYFAVAAFTLLGAVINEILQYGGFYNYKQSCDVVLNYMNDEKTIFLSGRTIYALFVGRNEFYLVRNRQWMLMLVSVLLVLDRATLSSFSLLQLTWSSTFGYVGSQYLYLPYLLYTIGCSVGTSLMIRYKSKQIYLLFGLIKITATAAILGIYSDESTDNCFPFLCIYYIALGVYSGVALHIILECTPLLYTELAVAFAVAVDLLVLEGLKYETEIDNTWMLLLTVGIGTMVLTGIGMALGQVLFPHSNGLIDMRNYLIGVRRHCSNLAQSPLSHSQHIFPHHLQPDNLSVVALEKNRVFQQYPREEELKATKF